MGFMDRLKMLGSPGVQAWLESEERWAEILEVRGDAVGPLRLAELRLGIHFSNQPMTERTITCRVPKGVEPQVGQHVAIHFKSEGQYHDTAVVIDWDKPPQYGAPPYDPQAAAEAFIQQFSTPTPTPATDASLQAKRDKLVQLRDKGALSDAEFEQAMRNVEGPAGG